MGSDQQEFSLNDLKSFRTIDNAIEDLISRRVDTQLRKGIDGRAQWFRDHLKLDFADYALDWNSTPDI